MALLTFSTPAAKNASSLVTLSKSDLLALPQVLSDSYFSVSANIKSVAILYTSTLGNQNKTLIFDFSLASPTANFNLTSKARDIFRIKKIIIQDFDDGELIIDRAQFIISNPSLSSLDIDLSIPTSLVGLLSSSNLALWYHTDTLSGYANLATVSSLAESSGTVWNASANLTVPSGGYTAPLYVSNAINGHAALRFSYIASSARRLAANITLTNQTNNNFHWFFVINLVSAPGLVNNSNSNQMAGWGTDNFYFTGLAYGKNFEGKKSWMANATSSSDYYGAVSPDTLAGEWLILEVIKSGVSFTVKHHRIAQGTLTRSHTLASSSLSAFTKLTFGPASNYGGVTFEMAETAFYKAVLTTPQRNEVISYLSNKYAIPMV